ncbi:MAG: CRISPR-associated helicase Cas3' [Candidatus Brocadiia bacterium]
MGELWAHSPNAQGRPQPFEEHLDNVAELAARFARKFGAEELGRLAGRWHDLGKKSREWQDSIRPDYRGGDRPDHRAAGALRAFLQGLPPVAMPIAGHHGGLTDFAAVKGYLQNAREDQQTLRMAQESIAEAADARKPDFLTDELETEFFIRMLFSALTDADFLDTERHFSEDKTRTRDVDFSLDELFDSLLASQDGLSSDGPLDAARDAVYRAALDAADAPRGFFSLTVPTGGGKTRTAMAFALKHALRHGLDRVIVVIPYTSIIEQNAAVYRAIFGDDAVVEHHVGLDPDEETTFNKLAAENWDAPIVVTTSVQFFESLHARKPSRCRKLHNIARSVVVLDEVQTLPAGLLGPTLDAMRELVEHYGVSFVLSTATQPAFRRRQGFDGLSDVREIAPDAPGLFRDFKRVTYQLPSGVDETRTWREVADEMAAHPQALCVVNTKKDALRLFRLLPEEGRYHLSTNMCPAHRSEQLDVITSRLVGGNNCRVVSTQLIEAGVDIDFPVVFRAFGPLDSIVQSAGRCNREGRRESGRVVVFRPADGGMPPGAYRRAASVTETMARDLRPDRLHDPELYEEYFRRLYVVSDLDEKDVIEKRRALRFQQTADAYRLIPDHTTPVLVDWGEGGELMAEVAEAERLDRTMFRRVQRFAVALYPHALARARQAGLCHEVRDGLFAWDGCYSAESGLRMKGYSPDDLVL